MVKKDSIDNKWYRLVGAGVSGAMVFIGISVISSSFNPFEAVNFIGGLAVVGLGACLFYISATDIILPMGDM